MLRFILVISALLFAFALGHALADEVGALVLGTLAVIIFLTWDTLQAARLMSWLKAGAAQLPKLVGFWGEMQYRTYQRLLNGQRETLVERSKLDHFLLAIQASPNGVALIDGEDKIEWCNAQLAGHLGIDRDRDRGQRIVFVVRNPEFVAYLSSGNYAAPITINSGEGKQIEVQLFPFGDVHAYTTVHSADDSGKLLLTRDVTEQERTNIMRRDFVANVSHELKTPLTVLKGFLETVQTLDLTADEKVRYMQVMLSQTERMQNLVNDLLTLAKLEGDTRSPEASVLQMPVMMESLLAQAQALSQGRHKIEMTSCELNLSGSQSELMSAFSNLVSNAIRYTPSGGMIKLKWAPAKTGEGAEFSVQDGGIGIAAEHIPRLTERFYRVDRGRGKLNAEGHELQGGTGLGLAIVKHALQRHGAELHIESTEGAGSIFIAHMPASRVLTQLRLVVNSTVKKSALNTEEAA